MFANQSKLLLSMTLVLGVLGLQACGNSSSEPKEKVEIKAAPKLPMMRQPMPMKHGS